MFQQGEQQKARQQYAETRCADSPRQERRHKVAFQMTAGLSGGYRVGIDTPPDTRQKEYAAGFAPVAAIL